MEQNFKDKKVLITGASKGLGKAAAIAFEKKGARLACPFNNICSKII